MPIQFICSIHLALRLLREAALPNGARIGVQPLQNGLIRHS